MAPIWKGALTFGLVNIPVRMEGAVRSDDLSFRLLFKEDLTPVKYQRVSETHPEPIPWDDIVKGYEYQKGDFVVLTPEDFESAAIASSRAIDILDFVREEEVDFRFFEKPYYLVPEKTGEKAYALLRQAIEESGTMGIGKVTLRTRQHLAAVKSVGDALVLELMRFGNELVDVDDFRLPAGEDVRPQELRMARQLIESLTVEFDSESYTDDYRENLERIIQAKMKGETVRIEEPAEVQPTGVIDLMARLQESLEKGGRARDRKKGESEGKTPAGKKAAGSGAGRSNDGRSLPGDGRGRGSGSSAPPKRGGRKKASAETAKKTG